MDKQDMINELKHLNDNLKLMRGVIPRIIKEMEKEMGTKVCKVEACKNSLFHAIDCLESNKEYGFFTKENDVRPSSCIWVDKKIAEELYTRFTPKLYFDK